MVAADDNAYAHLDWEHQVRKARHDAFVAIGQKFGEDGKAIQEDEEGKATDTFGRATAKQLAAGVVRVGDDEATLTFRTGIDDQFIRKFERINGEWKYDPGITYFTKESVQAIAQESKSTIDRYQAVTQKILDGSISTLDEARVAVAAARRAPVVKKAARPAAVAKGASDGWSDKPKEGEGHDDVIGLGPEGGFGAGSGVGTGRGKGNAVNDNRKELDAFQEFWWQFFFERTAAPFLDDLSALHPTPAQAKPLTKVAEAFEAEYAQWREQNKKQLPAAALNQQDAFRKVQVAGANASPYELMAQLKRYEQLYRENTSFSVRGAWRS